MFLTRQRAALACALATMVVLIAACSTPAPNTPNPTAPIALPAPTNAPAPTTAATTAPAVATTGAPTAAASTESAATAAPADTAAPTVAPAAAKNGVPVPPNYFGVSTYGEIMGNDEARALATLGGVQTVRTGVDWSGIEKTKGKYDWGYTDSVFKNLTDNNFAPLVLILSNPKWAATTDCGPVSDLPAFEAFMEALAKRYPKVEYWALYNEPDDARAPADAGGGCFGGGDVNGNGKPDVEDYAEQLHIGWRGLHAGNPNAKLVTGALAMDNFTPATVPPGYPGGGKGGNFDYDFAQQLFKYMAAHPLPAGEKYFDLFGFDFYGIYGPYWEQQTGGVGVSAKADQIQKWMDASGVRAPLYVSETGDDSSSSGEQEQSQFAVKTLVRGLASALDGMVWWTYQDFSDSAPPPQNTWKYGLIDQGNAPKPSYKAFQMASHTLSGATFGQALNVSGGEAYLFSKDGGGIAVLWSASDTPVTVAFSANKVQVTDMFGTARVIADGSPDDHDDATGRIGVMVDGNPVYVQVTN